MWCVIHRRKDGSWQYCLCCQGINSFSRIETKTRYSRPTRIGVLKLLERLKGYNLCGA